MRPLTKIIAVLSLTVLAVSCFRGDERDKDVPPGLPGGLCLAPDGHCDEGQCNKDRNYCFDLADPCKGFFCGGEERGLCTPSEDGEPRCTCEPGFNNQQFDLYCCPEPETGMFDPLCSAPDDISESEDG